MASSRDYDVIVATVADNDISIKNAKPLIEQSNAKKQELADLEANNEASRLSAANETLSEKEKERLKKEAEKKGKVIEPDPADFA